MITMRNTRQKPVFLGHYNILQKAAFVLIRFYKLAISPHLPGACRYYPTCSAYAFEAIEKFGFFHGSFMAIKRILRCHPFSRGGYDPVEK